MKLDTLYNKLYTRNVSQVSQQLNAIQDGKRQKIPHSC